MKAKTRTRLAKIFAALVVILIIIQVFLPLFNSAQINNSTANLVNLQPEDLPPAEIQPSTATDSQSVSETTSTPLAN